MKGVVVLSSQSATVKDVAETLAEFLEKNVDNVLVREVELKRLQEAFEECRRDEEPAKKKIKEK